MTHITSVSNTDVTIDVSSIFENGTQVVNAYDGTASVVADGKVTFNSGAHNTILVEKYVEKPVEEPTDEPTNEPEQPTQSGSETEQPTSATGETPAPTQAGTNGGNAGTQTTPSSNNNASNTTNSNTTSNAATGKVATGDATATALLMALLMAAGGTVVFARKRIYDKSLLHCVKRKSSFYTGTFVYYIYR